MATDTTLEYYGTGKRKSAIARVYLRPGTGKVTLNSRLVEDYFKTPYQRNAVLAALSLTNMQEKFDLIAFLRGGGVNSQAEAVRHGVSRALVSFNPELRDKLKEAGFLTRDPRQVERKKYGQPGARKRYQYSKR